MYGASVPSGLYARGSGESPAWGMSQLTVRYLPPTTPWDTYRTGARQNTSRPSS